MVGTEARSSTLEECSITPNVAGGWGSRCLRLHATRVAEVEWLLAKEIDGMDGMSYARRVPGTKRKGEKLHKDNHGRMSERRDGPPV